MPAYSAKERVSSLDTNSVTGDRPSTPEALQAADWPNRASSTFVEAGGIRWHVQSMGSGPLCLLLHGTGASTHSWRDFAPALAKRFSVIALDLPGHGFTQTPPNNGMTLLGMAKLVSQLLEVMNAKPLLAVGNSAGAAVLMRMSLDHQLSAPLVVSLNGALLPYEGFGRKLYPALARLMFLNPVAPRIFAWRAKDQGQVDAVITNTGSNIDAVGLGQYAQLFRNPAHVAATLRMMANWDLESLERDMPGLKAHLVLVATADDRAIPAELAFKVRDRVPGSEVVYLRRLGHLAHEEQPQEIAGIVMRQAEMMGILKPEMAGE